MGMNLTLIRNTLGFHSAEKIVTSVPEFRSVEAGAGSLSYWGAAIPIGRNTIIRRHGTNPTAKKSRPAPTACLSIDAYVKVRNHLLPHVQESSRGLEPVLNYG